MAGDRARDHLFDSIVKVVNSGVPSGTADFDASPAESGIPCDDESNEVKYAIDAVSTKLASSSSSAITAMVATLNDLGYRNHTKTRDGVRIITFSDGGGGGQVLVFPSGQITVDSATKCVDNPVK